MASFAATLEDLARGLQFGMAKAAIQIASTAAAVTFTDAGDLVGLTAHGFAVGDVVVFPTIVTTTGATVNTPYFVKTVPDANSFTVSATSGGSTLALTTNGTGTVIRARELRLRMANAATSNPDVKTTNYEGDNIIVKNYNLQSLSFELDTDAFPEGAHAAIYGLTAVTANLPDSYTNAYALYGTAAEQTGQTIGFWFETNETYTDASGVQSSKTVRYWCPVCTLTPTKAAEAKTSDKPGQFKYAVSVTDFAPTKDVRGVALPAGLTGAPVIRMTK